MVRKTPWPMLHSPRSSSSRAPSAAIENIAIVMARWMWYGSRSQSGTVRMAAAVRTARAQLGTLSRTGEQPLRTDEQDGQDQEEDEEVRDLADVGEADRLYGGERHGSGHGAADAPEAAEDDDDEHLREEAVAGPRADRGRQRQGEPTRES